MLSKYFLPFLVVVIVLILIFLIIAILKKAGNSKVVVVKKRTVSKDKDIEKKEKPTIKKMVEIAANKTSTTADLKRAIDIVAKDLPFPKKDGYKVPKSAKVYLNFALLIASHKNADAKLIAYMDRKLKKANPEYTTEIDIYENEGFNQRGRRL